MATIRPPGAKVTQTSVVASTTIQTPSMPACIIGPCMELMEVRTAAGSANPTAKVSVPAVIAGTDTAATKALHSLSIRLSVGGGADQEVEFDYSPSDASLAVSLVSTALDEGLTGVTLSTPENKATWTTTALGNTASLLFKKAKVRINHGAMAAGTFAVGQDIVRYSGGVAQAADIIGVVTLVGSGYIVVETLDASYQLTTGFTSQFGVDDTSIYATATSSKSAYDVLGMAAFVGVTVEGHSTYSNRRVTIPFLNLPVSKGVQGKLDFDLGAMNLFRLQGGTLKEFAQDAAPLRNRNTVVSTTLQQARKTTPSGAVSSSASVTYMSVPGINGSEIDVVHHRTVVVMMAANPAAFTVGRCVVNVSATPDRFIGRIVSKTLTTLTIALYGTAVIGDLGTGQALTEVHPTSPHSAATHGLTAAIALTVPVVNPTSTDEVRVPATESRLVKCAVSSSAGFTVSQAAFFASSEIIGTDDNPVTSGVVAHVATGYVVIRATGVAPVAGVKLFTISASQTVTAVTALSAAKTVVVYVGEGTFAAQVAHAVNVNTTAAALVTATIGGDPAGSSVFTGDNSAVHRLAPIAATAGDPAATRLTAYPFDDRDGDSVTPYIWVPGRYASYTHGSGTAALTFTARGGQDLTAPGDCHGVYGNDVAVTLLDVSLASLLSSEVAVTIGSDDAVTVAFDGPAHTGTHGASAIALKINNDPVAKKRLVVTSGGTGVPTGLYNAKLFGGADPVNFQATPDHCVVVGQRTAEHFRLIKCTVGSTSGFTVGETVKLSNTSGAVAGAIREINSTAGILWIDSSAHAGVLGTYTPSSTSFPLDDHAVRIESLYAGWALKMLNGPAIGLTGAISAYSTGGVATAPVFSTDPVTGNTYEIVAATGIAAGITLYGASSASTTTVVSVVQRGVSAGDTLTFRVNGGPEYTTTFTAVSTFNDVETAINATSGVDFAVSDPADGLAPTTILTLDAAAFSGRKGIESIIELGGSAVEKLFGLEPSGLTYAGLHEGVPYKTLVGDELENGSAALGTIVKMESLTIGSRTFPYGRLRVNSDTLVTTGSYTQWWIKARNITLDDDLLPVSVGSHERPSPGVVLDEANEELRVTQGQARLVDGMLDSAASQGIYVDYDAVRQDVSGNIQTFGSYSAMEAAIGPVTPENPLAWAMYAALQNSGGVTVSCIGVDDTNATYPEGTLESYRRALELLQTKEVFWLVPLTQDADVHDAVHQHVTTMSAADNKRERRALYTRAMPSEEEPTLVGTGSGELTATNTILIDADDLNVVDALVTAGIDDPESLSWSELKEAGVYLQITSNVNKYSVSAISGQTVTLAVANFEPGENSDLFFASTSLVDGDMDSSENVTLKIRGADLDITTEAGRDDIVAAMALQGQHFANSRAVLVEPDRFGQNYNSVEQSVAGYYYCAALAGMFSSNHPAQPYSRSSVVGFTRPLGSNDTFTEVQLDTAAGGGIWWAIQEVPNGPVLNRHQLTTDVSSIETRELSIVVPGDWIAKAARTMVSNIPGRANITDQLMSMVALSLEGLADYVRQKGVAKDLIVTSIVQPEASPDTIEIEMDRQPLYPCNTISMTIQT